MSASEPATNVAERPRTRAKRQRSALTGGRQMFVEGDPNSAWARRYQGLVAGHVGDLGGRDVLSEAQLSLICRASATECELEQMSVCGRDNRPRRLHSVSLASAASSRRSAPAILLSCWGKPPLGGGSH
jgi:hypothetical protein